MVQLANTSGAVLWNYDYGAFGNEREISGQDSATDANPFRYCGEYFDKETGTLYLRARYYSPVSGRFISEDPHWNQTNMIYGDNPLQLNEYTYAPDILAIRQSGNLYVYSLNNPLFFIDPLGLAVRLKGAYGEVGAGLYGKLQLMKANDDHGNAAWVFIGSAGGGLGLGAGGTDYTFETMDTIWDLQAAFAKSAGVSISAGPVGADWQTIGGHTSTSAGISADTSLLQLNDIQGWLSLGYSGTTNIFVEFYDINSRFELQRTKRPNTTNHRQGPPASVPKIIRP